MAAHDEQHLYSLPYGTQPMSTNDYNELTNLPKINNVTVKGDKTLADYGVPTKTSELTNDAGFVTESDIPTKTSELTNDSDFTTKSYIDGLIDGLESKVDNLDGMIVMKNFAQEASFSSTFDNLATSITTALSTIKTALQTGEFAEIKTLRINTIGNVKPTQTIKIDSTTDLLSLVINWQGFVYYNDVVEAIDIVGKKVLHLTMTNDTNDDAFVSYFNDSTAYSFVIEYDVYTTISLE